MKPEMLTKIIALDNSIGTCYLGYIIYTAPTLRIVS